VINILIVTAKNLLQKKENMMMKMKSILSVVFCCLILCVSKSPAQDFKKVIAIVDEMEKSLKGMIALEETQRETEISGLQKDIQNLQVQIQNTSTGVNVNNRQNLEALTERISLLENKVNNLNAAPEIKELAGQLAELKKVIESIKPTPVQTQPSLFSIKTGFLIQTQAQAIQEQTTALQDADPKFTRRWQRQAFIRRVRIILGGDIAKNTTFFFETDAPNVGKVLETTETTTTYTFDKVKDTLVQKDTKVVKDAKNWISMYVQDAQVQYTFCPELSVIAGLQLVGIARNGLQSAASLMALDYGAYQFVPNAPLDNNVGRDLGINFRGFILDDRLEYRAGFFSGKNTNLYSPFRFTTRLNYSFKDKEKGFYYTGTTLGKGNILSFGAGADMQGSYLAYSFDGMIDMPLGDLGSLTLSAALSFLDGGGTDQAPTPFTTLIPKQSVMFFEAGYFFKDLNLQPYIKYETQDVNASVLKQVGAATSELLDYKNKLKSNSRFGLGFNYFFNGHNANLKILYEIVSRNRDSLVKNQAEKATNGMFTLQLQYFTF